MNNEPVAWMHKPSGMIFDEIIEAANPDDLVPLYTHPMELQTLVKSFFEDYLDYQEESDGGRVFNPIHVSCTRVMMIEPLAKLLIRMRELSGVSDGA
jgi:hypothetical protein